MSAKGNGFPGQNNTTNGSGNIYATQNGNINFNTTTPGQPGLRVDTKALLIVLPANGVFFLYGMLAYTGRGTSGDNWRAGIFLVLFFLTLAMVGRWIRRRI